MQTLAPVFPLRKFYTEQMLVSFRMQLRRHTTNEAFLAVKGICDSKFRMLQVRKNEISLRK